ncbi:MAG: signal peptidase I [Candidatus Aenigmatarchaeota archaeon]
MFAGLKTAKHKWDKLTEGWAGSIIYIVLGFAIALGINTALGLALQTDTPVVAVMSDSMVPTLLRGDMVIVYKGNVSIGDIIVFDAPGYNYPIIHRVYNITDGMIRTKGDHNPVVDPWEIDLNAIHGKAGVRIPLLGWVKIGYVAAISLLR